MHLNIFELQSVLCTCMYMYLSLVLDLFDFFPQFCDISIKVVAKLVHILLPIACSFIHSRSQSHYFWAKTLQQRCIQ